MDQRLDTASSMRGRSQRLQASSMHYFFHAFVLPISQLFLGQFVKLCIYSKYQPRLSPDSNLSVTDASTSL